MATAKKCMSCGGSMKKMKTGGITQDIVGMPGYNATTRPMQMKAGGAKMKKYAAGGATKATKFAALAPPYNKATAADRIAGAKKNARKKK
tara:strand:+ start:2451 stop:2720 length:270 start_codon:yes stop_codon:yes gene_type:complete